MRASSLKALCFLIPLAGMSTACEDTDVPATDGAAPGQEIESGMQAAVEPVDLQAQRWFRESGVVEFRGRSWLITGEPVYDPAVERVGEYQGTPLYAEVGTARPYGALFIPLENDLWQMLTPASEEVPDSAWGESRGTPGIEPVGDPTGGDGGR
ncbi:MAG: hypothetical protein KY466_07115 [Gemmatimonadetes bacterium]|nr:hypothetical protein [Gemmatimonadota bacterium]